MNINGLRCLLDNIIDESAETSNKNIRKLEIVKIVNDIFLKISFCDNTEKMYKLYEKEICEDYQ